MTDGTKRQRAGEGGWRDLVVMLVAVLSLLGFAAFIIYLLGQTASAEELVWTRAVYLLTGVEAVAFAAAGFLFGSEVHRRRAENAEQRADEAASEATEAQSRAAQAEAKGTALATAVTAKLQKIAGKAGEYEAFGPSSAVALTKADLEELQTLAQQLITK